MNIPRVIPVLLLRDGGVVKSVRFKDHTYIGDPLNAVRIFNEKEVDEIAVIDIGATIQNSLPDFDLIKQIAGEAFMPMSYGGGITEIEHIRRVINNGVEKVILQNAALSDPGLIREAAGQFGSQSIIVCLDVKRNWWGRYEVRSKNGRKKWKGTPQDWAIRMEDAGAGELIIQSVDRDGTMKGYDHHLQGMISNVVNIPVVALGGANSLDDMKACKQAGASAVAAGSFFVFQGPHRAVLISYPKRSELLEAFKD
ncbi:MAG: AglZ/HisF2 family acetamidino modification protein [Saprospiraceae bacterium]|nr:AglZ/HisF2 family acetamidino modification protein [Saprospiraceae bacterium]